MAKFYVNQVHDEVLSRMCPRNSDVIGLFRQCHTVGRGSFCGYYASEFYLDTEMYAYYFADATGPYTPETRISEVFVCDPPSKFKEAHIATHMWTRVIEADTVTEAINLFENADWRRWESPFDEPGMIPISPCPKCGKKPDVYYQSERGVSGMRCVFECRDCGVRAETFKKTEDTARLWNKIVPKLKGE